MVDQNTKGLAHWIHEEMQNKKKETKYTIPWLLLPMIAKRKAVECAGANPDAEPSLDFSQSELQQIALRTVLLEQPGFRIARIILG